MTFKSAALLCFSRRLQGLGDERVVQLKAGWKHTLAVTDSGKFYSWGRNVNGQVGRRCGVCGVMLGWQHCQSCGLLPSPRLPCPARFLQHLAPAH